MTGIDILAHSDQPLLRVGKSATLGGWCRGGCVLPVLDPRVSPQTGSRLTCATCPVSERRRAAGTRLTYPATEESNQTERIGRESDLAVLWPERMQKPGGQTADTRPRFLPVLCGKVQGKVPGPARCCSASLTFPVQGCLQRQGRS